MWIMLCFLPRIIGSGAMLCAGIGLNLSLVHSACGSAVPYISLLTGHILSVVAVPLACAVDLRL